MLHENYSQLRGNDLHKNGREYSCRSSHLVAEVSTTSSCYNQKMADTFSFCEGMSLCRQRISLYSFLNLTKHLTKHGNYYSLRFLAIRLQVPLKLCHKLQYYPFNSPMVTVLTHQV